MTEADLQTQAVRALRKAGYYCVHVPNENPRRSRRYAGDQLGIVPGFPDLLVLHPVKCAIELKLPGNYLRDNQLNTLRLLVSFGFSVSVCHSVAEVEAFIELVNRAWPNVFEYGLI